MSHALLLIDDEPDITDALERQFRKKYKVFKANSGVDGLKVLRREKISCIISDQRMPQMTGVEFFEQAQRIQPESIRILLTGFTDVASIIAAINSGQIYRYVTKPWDPNDLEIAVQRGLESFELRGALREALENLKILDKAKSHFMILIGHELKTPLTTIQSFLGLLKDEKGLSDDAQKYLSRIEQGSNRLQEIVFDVLELMAAETGQMTVHSEKFSLESLIDSLTPRYQALAEKRKIEIKESLGGANVIADRKIVGKVLDKILHNAVKFAEEESTVEIAAHPSKQNGQNILIQVINTGPEVSPATIEKILKPFSMDEDIMHHSQGMGLGLSLSQALLKRHQSELQIHSKNKETIIGFTLSGSPPTTP